MSRMIHYFDAKTAARTWIARKTMHERNTNLDAEDNAATIMHTCPTPLPRSTNPLPCKSHSSMSLETRTRVDSPYVCGLKTTSIRKKHHACWVHCTWSFCISSTSLDSLWFHCSKSALSSMKCCFAKLAKSWYLRNLANFLQLESVIYYWNLKIVLTHTHREREGVLPCFFLSVPVVHRQASVGRCPRISCSMYN